MKASAMVFSDKPAPVEDYIKGTMKLELSPAWLWKLSTQIIVSHLCFENLRRHEEEVSILCYRPLSRYGGINAEDPVTNRLVEETKGLVLTYQNELASAVFIQKVVALLKVL